MKGLASILAFMMFIQSLAVCGPEVAHHKHRSHSDEGHATTSSIEIVYHIDADVCKAGNSYDCCIDHQQTNHKHSKNSQDKKDCCDDACHCFCCAKILLHSISQTSYSNNLRPVAANRPIGIISVHSFDFCPSISNPPQYLF